MTVGAFPANIKVMDRVMLYCLRTHER